MDKLFYLFTKTASAGCNELSGRISGSVSQYLFRVGVAVAVGRTSRQANTRAASHGVDQMMAG
nr:hypothetical protein Itr_chr05CG18620 [Ipomoea trifida]